MDWINVFTWDSASNGWSKKVLRTRTASGNRNCKQQHSYDTQSLSHMRPAQSAKSLVTGWTNSYIPRRLWGTTRLEPNGNRSLAAKVWTGPLTSIQWRESRMGEPMPPRHLSAITPLKSRASKFTVVLVEDVLNTLQETFIDSSIVLYSES